MQSSWSINTKQLLLIEWGLAPTTLRKAAVGKRWIERVPASSFWLLKRDMAAACSRSLLWIRYLSCRSCSQWTVRALSACQVKAISCWTFTVPSLLINAAVAHCLNYCRQPQPDWEAWKAWDPTLVSVVSVVSVVVVVVLVVRQVEWLDPTMALAQALLTPGRRWRGNYKHIWRVTSSHIGQWERCASCGIFRFRRKCPLLPGSPGSALNLWQHRFRLNCWNCSQETCQAHPKICYKGQRHTRNHSRKWQVS